MNKAPEEELFFSGPFVHNLLRGLEKRSDGSEFNMVGEFLDRTKILDQVPTEPKTGHAFELWAPFEQHDRRWHHYWLVGISELTLELLWSCQTAFCSSSSSSSIELADWQSATSTLDGFYTKRLLSVVCVILGQENLKDFPYLLEAIFCMYTCIPYFIAQVHGSAGVKGGGARANTSK